MPDTPTPDGPPQDADDDAATTTGLAQDSGEDPQPMSVGRRLGRILAVVVAVGVAGLWAYALWGPVQRVPQGRLDADTFPTAAEPVCAETMTAIDGLPAAYATREAVARADVVAEANVLLGEMLVRLDALEPLASTPEDARMVSEWLSDWRVFLGDRQRYVAALSVDPGARMLVTEKERRQISEPIDYFSGVNDMPNCATPGDLA